MACLQIGYQSLLLPSDKAMKVAEALQQAVQADRNWEGHQVVYTVNEEPLDVQFALVRPNQVRMPSGDPYPAPKARALPLSHPRLPR
jgi:hypothetical protein